MLEKTLGVPLFQEHAMRIAIVAAGFKPGEADRLRRAMATFKRIGTIGTFREKIHQRHDRRAATIRQFATNCWNQIEGFGSYGFPESHAASFANLVYASAWIKCHYPDVFAAALLNSQPMGFYATAQLVRDAQEHGVEVRPVDVNCLELGLHAGGMAHSARDHLNTAPRLTCADDIRTTRALRLGLREITGFSEEWAKKIESRARCGLQFHPRSLAAHRPAAESPGETRPRRCLQLARA